MIDRFVFFAILSFLQTTPSEVFMAHHGDLSISTTREGEVVVHFPDGLHHATGLFPNEQEQVLTRAFLETTFGRSLIMQLRTREIHDDTTSLLLQAPARAMIHKKIERLKSKHFEGAISVLVLDLDHFGLVNKRYGQNAGDHVLRWFSGILSQSVRTGDIISRWGGEEFVVVLFAKKRVDQPVSYDSTQNAIVDPATIQPASLPDDRELIKNGELIAHRICSATSHEPCSFESKEIHQTVTIGVASEFLNADSEPDMFERLFEQASSIMYRNKISNKRNCVDIVPTGS